MNALNTLCVPYTYLLKVREIRLKRMNNDSNSSVILLIHKIPYKHIQILHLSPTFIILETTVISFIVYKVETLLSHLYPCQSSHVVLPPDPV